MYSRFHHCDIAVFCAALPHFSYRGDLFSCAREVTPKRPRLVVNKKRYTSNSQSECLYMKLGFLQFARTDTEQNCLLAIFCMAAILFVYVQRTFGQRPMARKGFEPPPTTIALTRKCAYNQLSNRSCSSLTPYLGGALSYLAVKCRSYSILQQDFHLSRWGLCACIARAA